MTQVSLLLPSWFRQILLQLDSPFDTAPPAPTSSALAPSLSDSYHTNTRALSSSSPAAGALSNASWSITEDKELARLKEAIDGVSPEILHKFLRKEWRGMLFSPLDEEHIAYILRACLKNSPPSVVERSMKDALHVPAHRSAITQNILKHITVDELVAQVPENVLDEVAARRIDLAPVGEVVKWLADAQRLGYRHDDFLDQSIDHAAPNVVGHGEHNVDTMMLDLPQRGASQIPYKNGVASRYTDPLLIEQERQAEIQRQNLTIKRQQLDLGRQNGVQPPHRATTLNGNGVNLPPITQVTSDIALTCGVCGFLCASHSGYAFHTNKRVCQRQPQASSWQWGCANCGQRFTTKQGQNYHIMKAVCQNNLHDHGDLEDSTPEEHDPARAILAIFHLRMAPVVQSSADSTDFLYGSTPVCFASRAIQNAATVSGQCQCPNALVRQCTHLLRCPPPRRPTLRSSKIRRSQPCKVLIPQPVSVLLSSLLRKRPKWTDRSGGGTPKTFVTEPLSRPLTHNFLLRTKNGAESHLRTEMLQRRVKSARHSASHCACETKTRLLQGP